MVTGKKDEHFELFYSKLMVRRLEHLTLSYDLNSKLSFYLVYFFDKVFQLKQRAGNGFLVFKQSD